MKKFLLVVTAFAALSFSFIAYVFWLSPEARAGSANSENIQRVKEGMTKAELLLIMGPPNHVVTPMDWKKGVPQAGQSLLYQAPPLSSGDYGFYIDADSIVTRIYYGD